MASATVCLQVISLRESPALEPYFDPSKRAHTALQQMYRELIKGTIAGFWISHDGAMNSVGCVGLQPGCQQTQSANRKEYQLCFRARMTKR